MKLVKEVKQLSLADGIKVGDVLKLEDVMSCDSFNCIVQEINTTGIQIIKLPSMKSVEYTYSQLTRFAAKKMKIVEALADKYKPAPTKQECEKATEQYEKHLDDMIRQIFGGDGYTVKSV